MKRLTRRHRTSPAANRGPGAKRNNITAAGVPGRKYRLAGFRATIQIRVIVRREVARRE
jgi:hypothetical protein